MLQRHIFMDPTLMWRSAIICVAVSAKWACAQTIQTGNVTTVLGPSFFVDDATDGGSDTDIHQPNTPSFIRLFSGPLSANQGPTRVVITGLGFAAHTSAAANDASTIAVTFTYLGADEAIGGGDDSLIGTATGALTFTAGGEYTFRFASPLSADLQITGRRFRIQIAPSNLTNDGSLKLKTGTLTSEPAINSVKLSVAGMTTPLISPGRINLAKHQQVTVSSTNGQRHASYVTDGATGNDNRWDSATWQWNNARIDFPFPVEVGSAQVFGGIDDTLAISNFSIQYLDGVTWVTIPGASINNNTNVENNIVFTNPITASAFRLVGQDAPLRIRELALYPPNGPAGFSLGTDLTVNASYQRPAVASSHTAGNFPLKAVDGRTHIGSFWRTTANGTKTLDIDLQVNTKIGSAHLYSGSPGVAPLSAFSLKYWDGTAWQNIVGGSISGNTIADRVISFTPITTNKVRLEFTNTGTQTIRELMIFPANTGNVGYPLGSGVIDSGAIADYDSFHDAFYQIRNPSSNRFFSVSTGAQPALSQNGLTTAQGQYQVLLNLSDGSYRLRNRATGQCLAGAQLAKTPGLALVDEPYLALPHQDWILNAIGTDTFQFINQWSGLAIDTQGGATAAATPLIQNTANASATQQWRVIYSEKYPKKGIGGTLFAAPTEAKWVYRWGPTQNNPIPFDTSFYPMQWGNFSWDFLSSSTALWQYQSQWRKRPDGIHLMGFNEPDRFDQAGQSLDPNNPQTLAQFDSNRTIAESVRLWPRLLAMNQPLVSPVPASDTSNWFPDFYTQANNLGYRVDYTSIHLYPSPSAGSSNGLISSSQSAYNNFERPVWLTEFSFVDWGRNQSWSEEDNYQALAEFLWRAESLPWLRKYALFVFTEDDDWPQPATTWQNVSPAPRSNTYDRNGNLTAFGKLYAGWDQDATVRTNKTYFIHHKESRKRLASITTQAAPVGRNIRTDGSLVYWTLVSTGTPNRFYVVSSTNGRRLSSNGTTVTQVASGTTGTDVEWSLTEAQHGWYYLGHPASSRRLQLVFNNSTSASTYTMAANTVTTDAVQWRFIVPSHEPVWTGLGGNTWTNSQAWSPDKPTSQNDTVTFNELSVSNLATILGSHFHINGIISQNATGNISIGGTHTLTINSGGIDLSAATRDLSITVPTVLSAPQTWNVATSRTLSINGAISGEFPLTLAGSGITAIGASISPLTAITIPLGSTLHTTVPAVLASGANASNLTLSGTLDLRGTSQSINFISGNGIINNTSAIPAALTLGHNDSGGILNAQLQNSGGALSLIKTGNNSLTLPFANSHSGGFINNGTGNIVPQNPDAFGSGAVVMNGATLITSAANYTFANNLTLNSATLRVGGANNRTLTWNGSVMATGNTLISADTGTSGITINGNFNIANATVTVQSANFGTNIINGSISGANGNLSVSGTDAILDLNGNNTYSGTTTIGNGSFLRLFGNGIIPNNSNIVINGALTIRNTNGWIHNGNISGDNTNLINLNAGTNATLAGSISGIQNININDPLTNATINGVISGGTNITIQSTVDASGNGATLTLGGGNTYSGNTILQRGRLILGGANVLPDSSAVSIGTAILDVGTFTETVGILDPTTNSATIHLGNEAAISFANSSSINWTGGRLNINGSFVSGSSVRFGTNSSGLTLTQLGLITVVGVPGPYSLNSNGFLTAASVPIVPFNAWKSANSTTGSYSDDHDQDGVANGIEHFIAGTSNSTGFTTLPNIHQPSMSITWLKASTFTGSYGMDFVVETSNTLSGNWTTAPQGTAVDQVEITGNQVRYRFPAGVRKFARLKVIGP